MKCFAILALMALCVAMGTATYRSRSRYRPNRDNGDNGYGDNGGRPIFPRPHPRPGPGRCPYGVEQVNCYEAPCRLAKCPKQQNAKCENDYCGGCNAKWFIWSYGKKVEVTNRCY